MGAGDMAVTYRLGDALVEIGSDAVVTTFADGASVSAAIAEQPGQAEIAARLGITVAAMNRGHDLAHSLLAVLLGLRASPTLHAVAHGRTWPQWWVEEHAVLGLQHLASVLGLSIEDIAAQYSSETTA